MEDIRTKKRTPMPAKIAFAGENTWRTNIKAEITKNHGDIHKANALTKGSRKRSDDGKCCVEPLFRCVIAAPRLDVLLDIVLLVKDRGNVGGKVAVLEIGDEWM